MPTLPPAEPGPDRAWSRLCPGCFADKDLGRGALNPCPYCGFDETAPRSALALPLRTLLRERFLLGRVLGDPGGFGLTYLALELPQRELVAIKEYLPRGLARRDADGYRICCDGPDYDDLFRLWRQQFLAEAQLLTHFAHPHVVRAREFFEANGSVYLVMDYRPGLALSTYLQQHQAQPQGRRIAEPKALHLLRPLLAGLHALHGCGLVHGDIAPHAIYLARDQAGNIHPLLLGFGAPRQSVSAANSALLVVLSPGYAPPEQYHPLGRQGPWTDLYSIAAVLYRMLTGLTPLAAPERLREDLLRPAAAYGVRPELSDAIAAAMAIDPARRPGSVPAMLRLLPSDLLATSAADRLPLPDPWPSVAGGPPLPATARRWRVRSGLPRRAPPGWALAALAGIGVLLTGMLLLPALSALLPLLPRWVQPEWPAAAPAPRANAAPSTTATDALPALLAALAPDADHDPTDAAPAPALALALQTNRLEAYQDYLQGCGERPCPREDLVQLRIGMLYLTGRGVTQDEPAAAHWFEQAAHRGNADAQFLLGALYDDGLGVAADPDAALRWLRQAAAQGQVAAQLRLGRAYLEGRGLDPNPTQALHWFRQAAAAGDPAAQLQLARCYQQGQGVEPDPSAAAHWFRAAAEQGFAPAQYALGLLYEQGQGISADDRTAAYWYRLAAEQGEAGGQRALGLRYLKGRGVAPDLELALLWLSRAAAQGDPQAQQALAEAARMD